MVVLGILWLPFIKLISSQLYIYMQSVQAYISPPIAACFLLGVLWPRLNGAGAISSLMTGFILGGTRFVLEILDKSAQYTSAPVRWLIDMNFLHYAITMFIVCSIVLAVVSLATRAPDPRQIRGLTFATMHGRLEATPVGESEILLGQETPMQRRINIAASLLLIATIVSLWVYFR
jgi:SSS family solute:Na+ symporter